MAPARGFAFPTATATARSAPASGQLRCRSARTTRGKLAAAKVVIATPSANETVAKWSERWLKARETRGVATFRHDQGRLKNHVLPHIGELLMRAVTRADLEVVVEDLDRKIALRRGTADGLAWKTAANVRVLVTKMFDDAVNAKARDLRVRSDNPASGIRGPEQRATSARQRTFASASASPSRCCPRSSFSLTNGLSWEPCRRIPQDFLRLLGGEKGFEHLESLHPHLISNQTPSATRSSLRSFRWEPTLRPGRGKMMKLHLKRMRCLVVPRPPRSPTSAVKQRDTPLVPSWCPPKRLPPSPGSTTPSTRLPGTRPTALCMFSTGWSEWCAGRRTAP